MALERRKFLKMGVLSVCSTGLVLRSARIGFAQEPAAGRTKPPVESSANLPLAAQQDPVFWFKAETFKPYVGGFFEARNSLGEMIQLQLISVESFKPSKSALLLTRRAGESESFSLSFKAAAQLPPFTSIHRIKHPSLGAFNLFLTPRKAKSGELFYEAVINHIK